MSTLITTAPISPLYFRLTEVALPAALRRVGLPDLALELERILADRDAEVDELVDALDGQHAALLVLAASAARHGDADAATSLESISVVIAHVIAHEALEDSPQTAAAHLDRALELATSLGLLGHDGGPGGGVAQA